MGVGKQRLMEGKRTLPVIYPALRSIIHVPTATFVKPIGLWAVELLIRRYSYLSSQHAILALVF